MNDYAMMPAALTLVLGAASCALGEKPTTTTANQYFSSNYQQALEKHLAAARHAGAELHRHKHSKKGPDGKPLFADVALLGPADAANVIVVISGNHGVEGFCGSAVQTGLLRSGLAEQLPDSGGFRYYKRNGFSVLEIILTP